MYFILSLHCMSIFLGCTLYVTLLAFYRNINVSRPQVRKQNIVMKCKVNGLHTCMHIIYIHTHIYTYTVR